MPQLIYDENSLVNGQMYKYDKWLHSRINKYTGSGRTLVTYFSINDQNTTDSLGLNDAYQILGIDSPLRWDEIEDFPLLGMSPLSPENGTTPSTTVRNYNLSGDAFIIPGTIMPKENDFFIVNHLKMTHLIRVTEVTQDGLNTDGSYRISYSLFTTQPSEIEQLHRQVVGHYKTDLQTVGAEDLTPIIGKEDYELRSRLIRMVDDMVENYISNYYDHTHNCFVLHLNGMTLFDMCGNTFMAKHGIMIRDNAHGNIVLNENKMNSNTADYYYQRSVYKWIERDAPIRYLDRFKYKLMSSFAFPNSSFYNYGDEVQVMMPGDTWCQAPDCEFYFPEEVYQILEAENDVRHCQTCDCPCCKFRDTCIRHFKLKRYDYVSMIHDFIHGKIRSIHDLSLYTGDQLFDNSMSKEVFLWTPIIIYIIKQTLKIK
jgi:hypothetical protein